EIGFAFFNNPEVIDAGEGGMVERGKNAKFLFEECGVIFTAVIDAQGLERPLLALFQLIQNPIDDAGAALAENFTNSVAIVDPFALRYRFNVHIPFTILKVVSF